MKFIGTRINPDCIEAENVLRQSCINYEYVDITSDVDNLFSFVQMRDERSEFTSIKKDGFVGLPCFLMDDGQILFDENKVIAEVARLEELAKLEAATA